MKLFLKVIVLSIATLGSQAGFAGVNSHGATPEEAAAARQTNAAHHRRQNHFFDADVSPNRNPDILGLRATHSPVPDDHEFAYVLMSADDDGVGEIAELRRLVASNLPENVKLVILTTEDSAQFIRSKYEAWIPADRLILATDSNSSNERNGLWARDSFPVPVLDNQTNTATLVAHEYFRPFDAFKSIAKAVSGQVEIRSEVFVGGNLLADKRGNCFAVDSDRLFDMSPSEIQEIYGCASIHMLDHVAGIGDVDEVIKPLGENTMLTNQPSYVDELRDLGYNVIMLPDAGGDYRTYANTLIVGRTVFMPAYGTSTDRDAIQVYEDLGYHVVPVRSNYMSDRMNGSIHCQTMAYPAIKKHNLLHGLGLRELAE
jgi:hypothetical protein